MKIRKAKTSDFETIYKIMSEEYWRIYKDKWTHTNGIKTLKYYSKYGDIHVAEIDNKVIGFVVAHKEYYNNGENLHVQELVVKKEFQGKGIGKALMKKLEDYCRNNKIKGLYLSTNKKAPAFYFYKKLGYIPSKTNVFFTKEIIK